MDRQGFIEKLLDVFPEKEVYDLGYYGRINDDAVDFTFNLVSSKKCRDLNEYLNNLKNYTTFDLYHTIARLIDNEHYCKKRQYKHQ